MRNRPGRPRRPPADLAARLRPLADGSFDDVRAQRIAHHLGWRLPQQLTADERATLVEETGFTWKEVDRCLKLLVRGGYGQPQRKPRASRDHGRRQRERLGHLIGVLPRAIALRLPAFAQTRPPLGRVAQRDRWGRIECSLPLGAVHLAVLGAVCALFLERGDAPSRRLRCSRGELAYLVHGKQRRLGARQIARVFDALVDLWRVEVCATVVSEQPSRSHEIPAGPLLAGLRLRLDGELLEPDAYSEQLAGRSGAGRTGQAGSIEIELPEWIADAIVEPERSGRRRTYFDFQVFHSLWPVAQRLYLLLQGLGPSDDQRRRRFYLAPQQLVTLGLIGTPHHRAVRYVRAALTQLHKADYRYRGGFGECWHASRKPANEARRQGERVYREFLVRVGEQLACSAPTVRAELGKVPARRPGRGPRRGETRGIGCHRPSREDIERRGSTPELVRAAIRDSLARASWAANATRRRRRAPRGDPDP